jgi:uncharacterized RDD family membrane protein YckC
MPGEPGPGDEPAPEDQPTIAWTPPEPPTEPAPSTEPAPASEGGVGWAAIPTEGEVPAADPTREPAEPAWAAEPLEPDEVPPTTPWDPPTPPSPIISAAPVTTPTADVGGWQPPATTPPAPLVGWQTPGPAQAAPAAEGYVIAGAGARVIAYLIDGVLAGLIPGVLTFLLIDWEPLFREMVRQSTTVGTTESVAMAIPVNADYVLVTLIGLAISYLYFVGFWTSGGRATPGMRGLKMRVVDVGTGQGLSIGQATKRWIALGAPIGVLALVEPLQSVAGLLGIAITIFVFFSIITDDRKQGLHDKFANSLVIRSATSGDGATVAGCLVFGLLLIAFSIIGMVVVIVANGPAFEQMLLDIGNSI